MTAHNWQLFRDGDRDIYWTRDADGIERNVIAWQEGGVTLHTILVTVPDGGSEFLVGELEGTTVNDCIVRAEGVVLPDDDTGI